MCERNCLASPRLAFRTKWLVEKYLNEHYQMETHSAFIYFSSKGTDSNRVFTSCRWWVRHSIIYVLALLFASLHRLQQTFEHSSTRTFTLACTVANKLMLYIKKIAFVSRYSGATILNETSIFIWILVWAKCLQCFSQDVSYNHVLDNLSWNNNAK